MLHVNLEAALRTKEGGKSFHLGSLLRLRCVFDLFCVKKKRVFSFSSICYFVVVLVVVCRSCLSCTSLFFLLFVCLFVFIALLVSRSTVHVVEEKRRAAFFLSALCTSRSALFFFWKALLLLLLHLFHLLDNQQEVLSRKIGVSSCFFFLNARKGKKSLYIYACAHVRVSIGTSNFLSLMIVVLFVGFMFLAAFLSFSLNFFLCFTC